MGELRYGVYYGLFLDTHLEEVLKMAFSRGREIGDILKLGLDF